LIAAGQRKAGHTFPPDTWLELSILYSFTQSGKEHGRRPFRPCLGQL